MVRTSQATTFSSESYFDDRGAYGYAQPITEHVNVREVARTRRDMSHSPSHSPIHGLSCRTISLKESAVFTMV
jgi:hypothetical protein